MASKKSNTAVTIIFYIVLVMILVAVIAVIFKFTNGFTDDFKTFYVEYNGSMVISGKETELPTEEAQQFDVKYTFDTIDKNAKPKGYKLSVVPNVTDETDFEFTVDGRVYKFSAEKDSTKDFSKYFDIVKTDSSFKLTLHTDTTMQSVLEEVYTGKTVVLADTVDLREKCYFALVVESYNGKSSVTIPFRIAAPTLRLNTYHITL